MMHELAPLTPMGIVLVTGLLLLMFEVFSSGQERGWAMMLTVVGLGLALAATMGQMAEPARVLFSTPTRTAGPLVVDAFAAFSWALLIAGGLVTALLSPGYLRSANMNHAEYYALMLFAIVGMMVMGASGDLFTLFLGIETMSIAVYVLTGLRRNDVRATEAALKYFLMGAFATGFLLFGIAMIFGDTGSVALRDVAAAARAGVTARPIFSLGVVLFLIGMGFKIAAVPFHLWAPDVYEGAPTPVTGFMAVGVKAAAFVGLLRVVVVGLGADQSSGLVVTFLSMLAYLTIIVGNVLAAVQRNVKRMLAYSSVSHAGYAMIGVVAAARGEASAGAAVLFYLLAYTFTTLGAFGVLTFLERKEGGAESERFGAFAGVGFRHPALGVAMSLFMVALAGMPPTGGFFGKLYVFSAALRAGEPGLVVAGVLGSIVSVYYYLRVIVAFYMRDVPDPGPLPSATRSRGLAVGLALASFAVLYLGVFPGRWIDLGKLAVRSLTGS